MELNQSTRRLQLLPDAETLERLRLTSDTGLLEWLDILQVRWLDYQNFKSGEGKLSERALESLAKHFTLNVDHILTGQIDFRKIALTTEKSVQSLPELYLRGAHGRLRSTINSINFLESHVGWRLRLDVLRRFELSERVLQDPFAPISVQFITDLCQYLKRHQFRAEDFFAMGIHAFVANRGGIFGLLFKDIHSVREGYQAFFEQFMVLLERNCDYFIMSQSDEMCVVDVHSKPDVAAQLGVKNIGSEQICLFKAGMFSSIPLYLNQPLAAVRETSCVHHGDSRCRFEIVTPVVSSFNTNCLFKQSV